MLLLVPGLNRWLLITNVANNSIFFPKIIGKKEATEDEVKEGGKKCKKMCSLGTFIDC